MQSAETPCRHVAVLAVHGVADQEPNVTARQIANLLVDQDPAAGGFEETRVRIPVREMAVPQLTHDELWNLPSSFTFMYGQLTGDVDCRGLPHAGYKTSGRPEETYETVCLARPGADARPGVDIYEMYWADLSRLGSTFTQIFGEFYQLLFHLSSLGRHTVDEARDEVLRHHMQEAFSGNPRIRWDRFATAQAYAGNFLTLPIPILNLFLLCLASTALPLWFPPWLQEWATFVIYIGAGAGAIAYSAYRWPNRLPWLYAAVLAGAIAVVAIDGAFRIHGTMALLGALAAAAGYAMAPSARRWCLLLLAMSLAMQVYAWLTLEAPPLRDAYLLLLAWSVAIVALCSLILRAYDSRQPGAVEWGSLLGAVSIGAFVYFLFEAHPEPVRGVLAASEALFVLLTALWAMLLCMHIWAVIEGAILKYQSRRAARKRPPGKVELIERVVWTARLALILPTGLFIIVTLALWSGVVAVADQIKPASTAIATGSYFVPAQPQASSEAAAADAGEAATRPLFPYQPRFHWLADKGKELRNFREIGVSLISHAASPLAGLTLLLFAASVILGLWAFFPVLIAELSPPDSAEDSNPLGDWLDHAFRLLRWSGRSFFVAVIIVFPIGITMQVLRYFGVQVDVPDFGIPTEDVVRWVGAGLAGTAIALVTFRSRLTEVARAFRPVLDVALDVDNHLKERPLDGNPRAKIAARYASVLRHLCAWRDPRGEGYDAIVIVAHSQGTVITGDVLRFVKIASAVRGPRPAPADPALTRIDVYGKNDLPVYLLTVGCPLRQLYGLRFPDLYDWARHTDTSRWPSVHGPIPPEQEPDPGALNVKQWVNAYRSGDYVGRHLWRNDHSAFRWSQEVSVDEAGTRMERCIGPGGHTHYFDRTARAVGDELHNMIRRC